MKKNFLNRWFAFAKTVPEPLSEIKLRDNLTVLVVDDSRTQVFAVEKILKEAGINTLAAENGKQAIIMTKRHKPDLVLMDIVMPEINGFQATRYLARQKDTAHIPIIIVSGSDQESDRTWGLKLGAKDYMRKPIERNLMLEKVSLWTTNLSSEDEVAPISEKTVMRPDALAKAS